MMRYLVISVLLIVVSCKGSKVETDTFKKDQIQIHLQDLVKPQRIEAGFKVYKLKFLCRVEDLKNIAVYRFDTTVISRALIVAKMDKEVGVKSATKTKGCTDS